MDIQTLAAALKTTAMTGAQIMALDASYLCQNPHIAIQTLKSVGFNVTTTNVAGVATFQIAT
jgi:hypothetical protein